MNSLRLLSRVPLLSVAQRRAVSTATVLHRRPGLFSSLAPWRSSAPSTTTYNDDPLGLTSLMRSFDRDFEAMRNRMFDNISSTMNRPFGGDLLEFSSNDFITTDKDGNRKFELNFNMRGFSPEEIKVRTEGRNLIVQAKKESSSKDQYFLREFSQSYVLPEDLKLEDLKSKWTDDNMLSIEAPLPKTTEKVTGEKTIPIEHKQQPQQQIGEKQQAKSSK